MNSSKALAAQLLVAAFAAGCAAPGGSENPDELTAATRAAIDAMPEVTDKDLRKRPHENLGQVEGVMCRRSYWGSAPSWEETVRRTKYEAMKKGANAIARLDCGLPEGRSYTRLCFDSIRCTADAIRLRTTAP